MEKIWLFRPNSEAHTCMTWILSRIYDIWLCRAESWLSCAANRVSLWPQLFALWTWIVILDVHVFVSGYPSWYAIFDLTDIGFQKPYLWQPWHTNFALHPHKLYMVTFSMTSAFDGCEAWAPVTISLWVMNLNRNSRYWRFIFGRRLFDGLCKT